jgi:hypothetical protein
MRFASARPSGRSGECRPITDSDRLRARPSMMSSVMASASASRIGTEVPERTTAIGPLAGELVAPDALLDARRAPPPGAGVAAAPSRAP